MKIILATLFLNLIPLISHADSKLLISNDPVTSAKTWKIHSDGVHFSLTQILPEQLRAFYVNRGFTLEQIEPYATSCVYMTVLRNDNAPGNVHFVSNNWSIRVNNQRHRLKPVSEWVNDFKNQGIKKSAVIAFRWAQFPPEQEYKPGGDWNQGMLSIGLPYGTSFDAIAIWDIAGKEFRAKLTGVECVKP